MFSEKQYHDPAGLARNCRLLFVPLSEAAQGRSHALLSRASDVEEPTPSALLAQGLDLAAIARPSSPFIAARGLCTRISPVTCAGRAESTKIRSASAIASSTSWVTSTVIMRRLSTSLARSPMQLPGERRIERNERLVEQQQGRAERRTRAPAPCARARPTREFAGKMRAMLGEAERVEQGGDLGFAGLRRREPHIVLDAAPRQKPRLLKNHAHPAMLGQCGRSPRNRDRGRRECA